MLQRKLSKGVKASAVYTMASLLSKGIAIITVPIFTRIMEPSQIGVVNIYNSWHSIISVVASLSLTSGGFQLAMKEFKNERNQYVSSVLSLTSVIALLLGGIYFAIPTVCNKALGMSTPLIWLLIIHLLLFPAMDFWLMRQRYEYKYIASACLSVATSVVASAVSVWAVIRASNHGIQRLGEVRLYGNYAIQLLVALILWIGIFVRGRTFYSKKYWGFSLALSIPLIGNSFASQVLSVSDRVMIGNMVGEREVGIYGTLYTVSSISLLVWSSINSAFVPFLFDNIDKPKQKKRIETISTGLLLAFSCVALGMTIIAPEIVKILATEEYYEAIYIMPPIAAGVFLTAIANMYSNVLIYLKSTKYIMISTSIAAGINVIMNYFLIGKFGYMAASYTTLVAYVIHACIQGIVSTSIYAKKTANKGGVYNAKQIFAISVVTIVACLLCLLLYKTTWIRFGTVLVLIIVVAINRKKITRYLDMK